MAENCEICNAIEKQSLVFFNNGHVVAMLDPQPVNKGHVLITPVKHIPIFEHANDDLINQLFNVANQISMLLFELLNCHGTNIIINNGIPAGQDRDHFAINIIPRNNNDNLDFSWTPSKADENELSELMDKIKSALNDINTPLDPDKVKSEKTTFIPKDDIRLTSNKPNKTVHQPAAKPVSQTSKDENKPEKNKDNKAAAKNTCEKENSSNTDKNDKNNNAHAKVHTKNESKTANNKKQEDEDIDYRIKQLTRIP